ncbi:hypothetical protein D3C86_1204600 [compost metagenome]
MAPVLLVNVTEPKVLRRKPAAPVFVTAPLLVDRLPPVTVMSDRLKVPVLAEKYPKWPAPSVSVSVLPLPLIVRPGAAPGKEMAADVAEGLKWTPDPSRFQVVVAVGAGRVYRLPPAGTSCA